MADRQPQNFKNHTRIFPLVHFVIFPILLFNLIWHAVMLYFYPSWDRGESILIAVALILISLAARLQAIKAQDRIIRLEEKLRFHALLTPELAAQAANLPMSKIISLRFASDAELPELVVKAVNDELKTGKEIKLAVKDWRGDYLRV